jgi:hypothetical protein
MGAAKRGRERSGKLIGNRPKPKEIPGPVLILLRKATPDGSVGAGSRTFADMTGNGKVAPISAVREAAIGPRVDAKTQCDI